MKNALPFLMAGLMLSTQAQSEESAHAGTAPPCVFAARDMPENAGDASKTIAEATVKAWIECMGNRPVVIPKARLGMALEKTDNAPLPYHLRWKEGPFSLTIGLNRKIDPSMSPEDIDASIAFIANDGFPMPGLDVDHWGVRGMTPSSSPDVRHTVVAVNETGIVLAMEMEIFAIWGRDGRVETIADAPTDPHAYLAIDLVRQLQVTVQLDIQNFEP